MVLLASTVSLWLKTFVLLNSAARALTPASGKEGKHGYSALGLVLTHTIPAEKLLKQQSQHPAGSQDGPARGDLGVRPFNKSVIPDGKVF